MCDSFLLLLFFLLENTVCHCIFALFLLWDCFFSFMFMIRIVWNRCIRICRLCLCRDKLTGAINEFGFVLLSIDFSTSTVRCPHSFSIFLNLSLARSFVLSCPVCELLCLCSFHTFRFCFFFKRDLLSQQQFLLRNAHASSMFRSTKRFIVRSIVFASQFLCWYWFCWYSNAFGNPNTVLSTSPPLCFSLLTPSLFLPFRSQFDLTNIDMK